jgi:hypothetical protein
MNPLSAIDAISPALAHTRRLLWHPRNWRLMLKIGAVAVFAQMGGANFNGNSVPNNLGSGSPHTGDFPHAAAMAAIVSIIIVAAVIGLMIGLAFFYIGSRLQFTLFEIVLRSDTTVAPIWRRYGAATWRWIGLKILFFLACFAVCAPFLIPIIIALSVRFSPLLAPSSSLFSSWPCCIPCCTTSACPPWRLKAPP